MTQHPHRSFLASQVIPILRLYFHGGTPAEHQDSFRRHCQLANATGCRYDDYWWLRYVAVDFWTEPSTGSTGWSDRLVWCVKRETFRSSTWDEAVATPCSSGTMLVADLGACTLLTEFNWQFSVQGHFRLNTHTHHTSRTFTMYGWQSHKHRDNMRQG